MVPVDHLDGDLGWPAVDVTVIYLEPHVGVAVALIGASRRPAFLGSGQLGVVDRQAQAVVRALGNDVIAVGLCDGMAHQIVILVEPEIIIAMFRVVVLSGVECLPQGDPDARGRVNSDAGIIVSHLCGAHIAGVCHQVSGPQKVIRMLI